MTTVRPASSGRPFGFPYQDYYASLRMPHLLGDRVAFQAVAAYSDERTLKYYGMGQQTIVHVRGVMSRLFDDGWRAELIESNPVARVRIPKMLQVRKSGSFSRTANSNAHRLRIG